MRVKSEKRLAIVDASHKVCDARLTVATVTAFDALSSGLKNSTFSPGRSASVSAAYFFNVGRGALLTS